jgi:hypothetical protein
MNLLAIVLLVLALACFFAAAFNLAARVNLTALGLAFVTIANLLRFVVVMLAIAFLSGCALSYETKSGSKWSLSGDPDAKQIRATRSLLF